MASNHSLVDDFLSGRTTQVEPPRQMPAGETTGEEGRNAQNLARVMDPSVMTSLFAKQQRLLTIVSEAQAIIAELQQYGMFPSLSPNAAGGASPGDAFLQLLSMNAPKPPTSDVWGTPAAAAATAGTTPSAASHPGQKMPATAYDTDAAVEMNATRGNSGSPYHNNASNAAGYFAPNNNNTAADDFKQGNKFGKQGGEYGANNNNNNSNKRGSTNNNNNAPILMENSILALVEFKRGRTRKYVCDNPDVTPGIYVLVDGDRGTDCGLLVQTIQRLPNGETSISCMDGCDINDEKVRLENGRVIRPATNEDIDRLHNVIANAEAVALKTCRQRCEEQGIDIGLVDVEYQFDMKKISFFFDCDHSVDFRNLVRELYRTFGARIWMENLNPKVKNSIPDSPHGGGRDNNNGHHYNNNNNNNSYYRRNNNRNDGNSKVYY